MGETSRQTGWCLAYGVVIHATDDGLVVEGDKIRRVRLHDARLERRVVTVLEGSGDLAELVPELPPEDLGRAVEQLKAVGAIVPIRERITVVDRLAIDLRLRASAVVLAESALAIERSDLTVLAARREDAMLGECIARCHEVGNVALVLWTSPGEVIAVLDDPSTAPCALCALRFDGRAARLSADMPFKKITTARSDHDAIERMVASSLVARYAADLSPLAAGNASVWDLRSASAATHEFRAHPACNCAGRGRQTIAPMPAVDWHLLERARFRPVTPLTEGGRIAHAAYRGAREPWPLTQGTFGIAIAAGEAHRERAVGEAIERFSMLHAPPAFRMRSRRDVDAPTLSREEIASLLYRHEEYRLACFRFRPFDDDLPLDWSWAVRAGTNEKLLVPTSLVGRPSHASNRLTDGTSNGYAAHPSEDEARLRALLEVVERDAILLRWYTDQELTRVTDAGAPANTVVLLATADVDLPVVVAAACLPEGSLRIGSAAAPSFDVALRRAVSELDGQLMGAPVGPAPDLARADCGFGPRDHVAYYGGETGRALLERWKKTSIAVSADELRPRWPAMNATAATAVAAVRAAGLDVLFVDRSLPDLFGEGWHVARALVPGAVEMSWGMAYRRLASPRIAKLLASGAGLSSCPHPYA